MRSVEQAAAYAVQVGRPMIHAMAGNIPEGADLARCRDVFMKNVDRAADTMAPRFQNLAKLEIDQYAFQRKSAERAMNPWMRGPMF